MKVICELVRFAAAVIAVCILETGIFFLVFPTNLTASIFIGSLTWSPICLIGVFLLPRSRGYPLLPRSLGYPLALRKRH